jgi:hypothetical protein
MYVTSFSLFNLQDEEDEDIEDMEEAEEDGFTFDKGGGVDYGAFGDSDGDDDDESDDGDDGSGDDDEEPTRDRFFKAPFQSSFRTNFFSRKTDKT